jgi:hypothetical protein
MLSWPEHDDSPTPELPETITPADYTVDRLPACTHTTLVMTTKTLLLSGYPLSATPRAQLHDLTFAFQPGLFLVQGEFPLVTE